MAWQPLAALACALLLAPIAAAPGPAAGDVRIDCWGHFAGAGASPLGAHWELVARASWRALDGRTFGDEVVIDYDGPLYVGRGTVGDWPWTPGVAHLSTWAGLYADGALVAEDACRLPGPPAP